MNVLICDDAAFMRMVLKRIVESNGITVIGEASNGVEAVSKYEELMPDVVTMDITMPELDGIGALKEIRKRHPDAQIIIVSAMGQQPYVVDAVKAGAVNFLVKPFKDEIVISTLLSVARQKQIN